jgi:nitronate monooxygenase
MAGVQDSTLTVAVSSAGGLGSLACAMLSPDTLRAEITIIREQTDKPFNVNFFCHMHTEFDADCESSWRDALKSCYQEYGINAEAIPNPSGLTPFDHGMVEVLEELKPPIVSFHFGLPAPDLLKRVKNTGARVMSSATSIAEAKWLAAQGVDMVIAQGLEAGGHRGMFLSDDLTQQMGVFSLLPQILEAVDVPVVAAGGIANAKGVAAAITLGAMAVQVGTTYLLCPEAKTSQIHRAALKSTGSMHTAITNIFSGRPARSIVNRAITKLGPISDSAPVFPLAGAALGPLRQQAEANGSGDFTPLWCGQNATGCEEISAGELTRKLADIGP